jgi:hypothetical protein
MKLTNTSVYPTPALEVLLHFVLRTEKHEARYLKIIKVTNCKTAAYRGRCNGQRILLRIGAPDKFSVPIHNQYRKRSPPYDVNGWKEGFVALFAHEAEHARHFAHRMGVDEIGCEHAAVRALKALREQREFIDARIKMAVENDRRAQQEREVRLVQAKSPEAKLAKLNAKIATWKKKLKTAETYLKKYQKQLRRLEKKKEPVAQFMQAAKTP